MPPASAVDERQRRSPQPQLLSLLSLLPALLLLALATADSAAAICHKDLCVLQSPEPEYTVLLGANVTLPCRLDWRRRTEGGRRLSVYWRLPAPDGWMFVDASFKVKRFVIDNTDPTDFSLTITNVTEAEGKMLECQALDDGTTHRFQTRLRVLDPPSQPVINHGISVERVTNLSRPVSVTCRCHRGLPSPKLTWQLHGAPLLGASSESLTEGTSTITLVPRRVGISNGSQLQCTAHNEAVELVADRRLKLTDTIVFVVYKRMGRPVIRQLRSEYHSRTRVQLSCRATPGVPAGKLMWLKQRASEREPSVLSESSDLRDGMLTNIVAITVEPEDHLARFTCRADNPAIDQPYEEVRQLKVVYPPDRLYLRRSGDADWLSQQSEILLRDGERATFQCGSDHFYGTLSVSWFLGGREMHNQVCSSPVRPISDTHLLSNYSLVFSAAQHEQYIKCEVYDRQEYRQAISARLFVYYPPSSVTLTVPSRIFENKMATFRCQTEGGRPSPEILWFVDNKRVKQNITENTSGSRKVAEMRLYMTRLHHGKTVFCRAQTSNIAKGVESDTVSLDVFFLPLRLLTLKLKNVKPRPGVDPQLMSGDQLEAVCEALGSNPRVNFTWYIRRCRLRSGAECRQLQPPTERLPLQPARGGEQHFPSRQYQGYDARSTVLFRLTPEDHLASLYCLATNKPYASLDSQSASSTLQVLHRPVIDRLPQRVQVPQNAVETRTVRIRANPRHSQVRVFKLDRGRRPSEKVRYTGGGVIEFASLSTSDAGSYEIEAVNRLGPGNRTFTVSVRTPLRIVKFEVNNADRRIGDSYFVRVPLLHSLRLRATVAGSPIQLRGSDSSVQWVVPHASGQQPRLLRCQFVDRLYTSKCWRRRDSDESLISLSVQDISRSNMGEFRLVVYNKVGREDSRTVHVYPMANTSVSADYERVSVQENADALLQCTVTAVPPVAVVWRHRVKDGLRTIEPSWRHLLRQRNLTKLIYTRATLVVRSVTPADYGVYFCEAPGSGQGAKVARAKVTVTPTSPPEPPTAFYVFNYTHSSVLLTWLPGHNGGTKQTFVIHCRVLGSASAFTTYLYGDHLRERQLTALISNLQPATTYEAELTTTNEEFPNKVIRCRERVEFTTREDPNRHLSSQHLEAEYGSRNLLIAGCTLAGTAVLVLNLICIIQLIRRRKPQPSHSPGVLTLHTHQPLGPSSIL